MTNNLNIGKLFGINTYIHWSFWLLPLFVFATSFLSAGLAVALLSTAVILAIFGCVALHEVGHALAARRYGVRTRDIILYPIGGVARLERMPRSAGAEIAIALAGPAVNVAIAAILYPIMAFDGYRIFGPMIGATALEIFWVQIFWANVGLAMFNLIPAFPMDGGRVFRALLSLVTNRVKATEIAAKTGFAFAALFGIVGLLNFGGWGISLPIIGEPGPMMIVLAVFLVLTAQAELRSVKHEERYRSQYVPADYAFDWHRREPIRHADGWEYDPQAKMWTLWQQGFAVKRVAGIG